MALKKMLGEILKEFNFITHEQLKEALKKQEYIIRKTLLPEKIKRINIITEARISGISGAVPLLGEILIGMNLVTGEQIDKALKQQDNRANEFYSLGNGALYPVIDMGTLINSTLNLTEVLSLTMKTVNKVTNSTASTLMLLDESSDELVFSVPSGPKADDILDVRIKKGQGIAGWVALNEEPVLIDDVSTDKRFYGGIDVQTGFKTRSVIAVPLKTRSKLIGVLEVINKEDEDCFTNRDLLLLTLFATYAAMAIENARLYSELKAKMEEEKNIREKLIESNRLQAVGQLASGLAHDFNNILSAIMGYTEMAKMDIPENNSAKEYLSQVLNASRRAQDLVEHILTFASEHKLESKPLDLKNIVDGIIPFLSPSIQGTVEITKEFPDAPCTVMGDQTKLKQMLLNICTNANHAMGEKGGHLTISLKPVEIKNNIHSSDNAPESGHYIKMSIKDTGPGMDDGVLKRIFEPYFSTKGNGMGIGLGLSVVQGIVKSHGGSINVRSMPGKGTTFEVLIPRVDKILKKGTDSLDDIPCGSENILFVDDEELLTDLGSQLFGHLGYNVISKNDPAEALQMFTQDKNAFDLVFTDLAMPKMTGDELAKNILEIRPDIPIILCTGFNDRINEKKAREIGIKAFMTKPMLMKDLAMTVRKCLDGISLAN